MEKQRISRNIIQELNKNEKCDFFYSDVATFLYINQVFTLESSHNFQGVIYKWRHGLGLLRQGLCDDSIKAFVLKSMTMWGGVSTIAGRHLWTTPSIR